MVFAVLDERHAQLCALTVKAERPDAGFGMLLDKFFVFSKIAAQDRDLRLGGVVLVLHTGRARDLAVLELSRMAGLTRTSSPKTASICSFVT